ncbi:hypothetical protein CsSME_00010914 [Camellia sinensis var. sinensis]
MGRSPCCEKEHTNKGAWTKEEDERLINYIKAHGEGCWRSLPKAAGLHRCGKSCRLRWINNLRPDLKRGNFTQEEDELIIHLHGLISRTRFPRRSFLGRGVPAESPDDHRRALSYGFLLGVEGGSSSRNRFSALLTPRLLSSAAALLALATSLPTDSIATVFFDLPPSTAFPTAASLLSPLFSTLSHLLFSFEPEHRLQWWFS